MYVKFFYTLFKNFFTWASVIFLFTRVLECNICTSISKKIFLFESLRWNVSPDRGSYLGNIVPGKHRTIIGQIRLLRESNLHFRLRAGALTIEPEVPDLFDSFWLIKNIRGSSYNFSSQNIFMFKVKCLFKSTIIPYKACYISKNTGLLLWSNVARGPKVGYAARDYAGGRWKQNLAKLMQIEQER